MFWLPEPFIGSLGAGRGEARMGRRPEENEEEEAKENEEEDEERKMRQRRILRNASSPLDHAPFRSPGTIALLVLSL